MAKKRRKGPLKNVLEDLPTGETIIGVYAIHFEHDSRVYIGSSADIRKRLRNHFLKLQKGTHSNYRMKTAFKKSNPHYIILNEYPTINQARDREQTILNETPAGSSSTSTAKSGATNDDGSLRKGA